MTPQTSTLTFKQVDVAGYKDYYTAFWWCTKHCKEHWTVSGNVISQVYTFRFISDSDYILFLLAHSTVVIPGTIVETPLYEVRETNYIVEETISAANIEEW